MSKAKVYRANEIAALVTPPGEAWPRDSSVAWHNYVVKLRKILAANGLGAADTWEWDPTSKTFGSRDRMHFNVTDSLRMWAEATNHELENFGAIEFHRYCELDPGKPLADEIARLASEKQTWEARVHAMMRGATSTLIAEVTGGR